MASGIDYFIIVAYFAVMLGAGYIGARRSKTHEDYLLAGRRLGFWMFFPAMAAVILGGGATFGGAKLGYLHGISGSWLVIMYGLGVITLALLVSTKLSNLRIFTISELLELRFDRWSRLISAIISAVYAAMIAVIQVVAIGTVINTILGWNLQTSMLVGGLIFLIYTEAGGMWSVTLTDAIQFWLMTGGVVLLAIVGLARVGGFSGLQAGLDVSFFSWGAIGGKTIFSFFLLYFLGFLVGQDVWQRLFTAKDARTARTGTLAAGIYCLVYAVLVAIIGIVAKVVVPGLENAQSAFPALAVKVLPAGLIGLVLAGALSALMSTASGPTLAASTLITRDIYVRFINPNSTEESQLRISRVVTLIVGAFVIVSAVWIQDVLAALDVAYDLLSGAIVIPVMAAFFWKRATWQGTVSSMVISSIVIIVTLAREGLTATNPIIYGIFTSLVVLVAVSLLTPPTEPGKLKEWEDKISSDTSSSMEDKVSVQG